MRNVERDISVELSLTFTLNVQNNNVCLCQLRSASSVLGWNVWTDLPQAVAGERVTAGRPHLIQH